MTNSRDALLHHPSDVGLDDGRKRGVPGPIDTHHTDGVVDTTNSKSAPAPTPSYIDTDDDIDVVDDVRSSIACLSTWIWDERTIIILACAALAEVYEPMLLRIAQQLALADMFHIAMQVQKPLMAAPYITGLIPSLVCYLGILAHWGVLYDDPFPRAGITDAMRLACMWSFGRWVGESITRLLLEDFPRTNWPELAYYTWKCVVTAVFGYAIFQVTCVEAVVLVELTALKLCARMTHLVMELFFQLIIGKELLLRDTRNLIQYTIRMVFMIMLCGQHMDHMLLRWVLLVEAANVMYHAYVLVPGVQRRVMGR